VLVRDAFLQLTSWACRAAGAFTETVSWRTKNLKPTCNTSRLAVGAGSIECLACSEVRICQTQL
jgi:hypothetical protein